MFRKFRDDEFNIDFMVEEGLFELMATKKLES